MPTQTRHRTAARRKGAGTTITRPAVPVLRFLGATGTVTGSRFLLDTPRARLLVECGLFQGLKELRARNWQAFPVDPASIDAVILTHAHLDHSGYVPALVKNGFAGPVYVTEPTLSLCRILLPDSGHIQEEDAAYANRRGFSKHAPALPLYTEEHARVALQSFRAMPFHQSFSPAPGVEVTFRPNGHILGSATATVVISDSPARTIVFSGDLGRPQHPVLRSPDPLPAADFVVIESTYGDRRHEDETSMREFESALVRTAERGGVVVIPSFAVDRTEVILYHLRRLMRAQRVPQLPVYVDSPMALETLRVYRAALAARSIELEADLLDGGDPFDPGQLIEARHVEDSMAINNDRGPAIIISASGMATGGRVLHHLAHRLPDEKNTVILVGYQAEGTRGRLLIEGSSSLKMLGRYVGVRAEIVNVPAFSVHADQGELISWLRTAPRAPETVFVVHGERVAAEALHDAIERDLRWIAAVPRYLEQVRLD